MTGNTFMNLNNMHTPLILSGLSFLRKNSHQRIVEIVFHIHLDHLSSSHALLLHSMVKPANNSSSKRLPPPPPPLLYKSHQSSLVHQQEGRAVNPARLHPLGEDLVSMLAAVGALVLIFKCIELHYITLLRIS